jgi:hypothetical protein
MIFFNVSWQYSLCSEEYSLFFIMSWIVFRQEVPISAAQHVSTNSIYYIEIKENFKKNCREVHNGTLFGLIHGDDRYKFL